MLLGIVLLFAVAVSNGWIGEGVRTLLGGGASAGLLGLGAWVHERRSRTDAALAATAAGIAGLFVTLIVAARVYELVPFATALAWALVVGAIATWLAVRWDSRGIAALGIVGALLAPVLADAPSDGPTLALLFVANASAVGVVIWRRWNWLALVAYVVATPQWLVWLFSSPPPSGAVTALAAFGALGFLAAVGYELRAPSAPLRTVSAYLLTLNAVVLAASGWFALSALGDETAGKVFLAALAAAHVAVGLRPAQLRRISREVGLLLVSLGVVVADIAFALTVDGAALAIGFTVTGVGFAALARRASLPGDGDALRVGLGGHVALALLHVVVVDAPPSLVTDAATASSAGAASLLALAAGCLVSSRLADDGRGTVRAVLDAIGLAAVAYLTALSLDGAALVLAWCIEACVLAAIASAQRDEVAGLGALAFLGGAVSHGLAFEAPAVVLLHGLGRPAPAALSFGASAVALLVCAHLFGRLDPRFRVGLRSAAAVVLLYLASAAIVSPFQPAGAGSQATLLDLGVRQQGQVVLSVFWSLVGLSTLVVGLLRDNRPLRIGGLSVLLVAVAKVFLFDLARLGSLYRVGSLVGLGVLLLVGAFLWQRVRPRSLPDLREAPEALR